MTGLEPATMDRLAAVGIGPSEFANPETRIAHRFATELLATYVAKGGDPTIGLRAGESSEPGDLDVVEFAARSCANLREALKCLARYVHLVSEAVELSLVEGADSALWRCRISDDVPRLPAANDFIVASTLAFLRRYTHLHEPLLEVHLMHSEPAYAPEYARLFKTRVRFGMPHNGFLLSRAQLEQPMIRANPIVQASFELRARELSGRLGAAGIRQQLTELVIVQLRTGNVCMSSLAREFAMSVATLRRRLDEEGTSFSRVVDEARRTLAETYLRDRRISITEIAFLLGFSHAPAFYGAFRRWTGTTPSEYRARMMAQRSDREEARSSVPAQASGR